MLELQKIVRRITQYEGAMDLDAILEAATHVTEERQLTLLAQVVQRVEVRRLAKGDAEVPRIEFECHGRSEGAGAGLR